MQQSTKMIYTTPYIERTLQFHKYVEYLQNQIPIVVFCKAKVSFFVWTDISVFLDIQQKGLPYQIKVPCVVCFKYFYNLIIWGETKHNMIFVLKNTIEH